MTAKPKKEQSASDVELRPDGWERFEAMTRKVMGRKAAPEPKKGKDDGGSGAAHGGGTRT